VNVLLWHKHSKSLLGFTHTLRYIDNINMAVLIHLSVTRHFYLFIRQYHRLVCMHFFCFMVGHCEDIKSAPMTTCFSFLVSYLIEIMAVFMSGWQLPAH